MCLLKNIYSTGLCPHQEEKLQNTTNYIALRTLQLWSITYKLMFIYTEVIELFSNLFPTLCIYIYNIYAQ